MDFISRDIAVVDISGDNPTPVQDAGAHRRRRISRPPAPLEAIDAPRQQLFNTAIGPAGTQANSARPAGRMSDTGWGTCYSCHPKGLTDTRDVDVPGWSAPVDLDGEHVRIRRRPSIVNGAPAAARVASARAELVGRPRRGAGLRAEHPRGLGRRRSDPRHSRRRRPAWRRFLISLRSRTRDGAPTSTRSRPTCALGVRAPISPVSSHPLPHSWAASSSKRQGCQNCHGGKNWTISALDFTPPPLAHRDCRRAARRGSCAASGTFDPASSRTA